MDLGKTFDVFISYKSIDKHWVARLRDELQQRGLKVWLDQDQIRPGDLFVDALENGLESSRSVALIVSPEAMASGWVREEYSRALSLAQSSDQPLQLIPVLLRDSELPGFLANRNFVDFRDEALFNDSLERLIWGITGEKPILADRSKNNLPVIRKSLQIVSLTAIERDPFPILDIKLLNRDSVAALIHRMELVVVSSKIHVREISTSPPLTVSHIYHILIDSVNPKSTARDLSFVVQPGSADRFHLVVGAIPGYLSGIVDESTVYIDGESAEVLEASGTKKIAWSAYKPSAVEVVARLRLIFNSSEIVESDTFGLLIRVDDHFKQDNASEIFDNSTFVNQVSQLSEAKATESVEILGYLDLEEAGKQRAEQVLFKKMKTNHIPTLVESASALAQIGHIEGLHWLINAATSGESELWLRIMTIRTLIRMGHHDREVYTSLMKSGSIPVQLEVLRTLGYLGEKSVDQDLVSLHERIDEVVAVSFDTYAHYGASERAKSMEYLYAAKRNRELEEIVRSLGSTGSKSAFDVIGEILQDELTYRELSYYLLITCIEVLGYIGGEQAARLLKHLSGKLSLLLIPSRRVEQALQLAQEAVETGAYRPLYGKSAKLTIPVDYSFLIYAREQDDFHNSFVKLNAQETDDSVTYWIREDMFDVVNEVKQRYPEAEISGSHFHNAIPDFFIAGEWRKHPRLVGRFHPEYPDDLEVMVHDGGPRISTRRPEIVWVRVTTQDDNIFEGRVLNQPHQLLTVKEGDTICFLAPEGGKYPILVTDQYLEERQNWIIEPCNKCGLSELFDPPSEIIKRSFQLIPGVEDIPAFTTFCGACGGTLLVSRKSTDDDEVRGAQVQVI